MSSNQCIVVIASKRPREIANFYGQINEVEILEGVDSDHYLVPLQNGLRIDVYLPSSDFSWSKGNRLTALCFQKNSSSTPMSVLEDWSAELIALGGKISSVPTMQSFGAEAWISDPDGNDFLILVPSD
tara:strand:- start:998 stop:1381 length:384 start_codon:yes stop_codon:yes gene_type:complete